MENQEVEQLKDQYDECISKINQLTDHVKLLSNEHQLQNLQQMIVPEEYLTLLAHSLYAVNSLAYSYATLKNQEMPPQFSKVQEYFKKAKNPLAPDNKDQPSVVVNKEAAKRVIKHSLK